MEGSLMDSTHTSLSLEQILGIVRRRALWIALCAVLVAGAAYFVSKRQTKQYTATASLVFNNNQLSEQISGLPTALNGNQQATNIRLVQLGDVGERTARILLAKGVTE